MWIKGMCNSCYKKARLHVISTGGAWARNRARRRRHQATEPQAAPPRPEQAAAPVALGRATEPQAAPPRPEQTRCAKCGSTYTSKRKSNGAPMWLKGICNLCYERARQHAQHVRHTG